MNTPNLPAAATSASARLVRLAGLALLLGGAATGALAQAYKIVGPDGKITYTDKPPAASDIKAPAPAGGGDTAAAGGAGGLPYATRQAMGKYPVTLYATRGCAPCDQARQALRQRGVPFGEYSVASDADIAALKSRFGDTTMPVITIGGQSMKGWSSSDLASYLDAAGYPAQARLAGYNWPSATPLVAPRAPVPVTAAAPSSPASPPPASNNGIQF